MFSRTLVGYESIALGAILYNVRHHESGAMPTFCRDLSRPTRGEMRGKIANGGRDPALTNAHGAQTV